MTQLFEENDEINGKWLVERFLGEGAFAQVYRVRHHVFGRQAMKVFKRPGLSLPEVKDLLQEAVLLANIQHPNIIRVFDADTTAHELGLICFFTTEYAQGGTLDEYWRGHGDEFVAVETAFDIFKQVVQGLALAHSQSPAIVHRDIKPQNILLTYDSTQMGVKIADFGLAKKFNPLTLALTGLGTTGFKPPEVLRDIKNDSPAGDVWAVGTCLYLLLTDSFPYADGFEIERDDDARFSAPLKSASTYNILVSHELDQLVNRCLAFNPLDRFSSAIEVLEALETIELNRAATIPNAIAGQIQQAIDLARDVSMLNTAADLLEHALAQAPDLKPQYASKIALWRKGISG
ncbi:MAG: serine/threonine protein kinase [Gammaproteobacteria bacterium]|nr:serine/threonine protein kinase [Gammaproteobacteria bacterium]